LLRQWNFTDIWLLQNSTAQGIFGKRKSKRLFESLSSCCYKVLCILFFWRPRSNDCLFHIKDFWVWRSFYNRFSSFSAHTYKLSITLSPSCCIGRGMDCILFIKHFFICFLLEKLSNSRIKSWWFWRKYRSRIRNVIKLLEISKGRAPILMRTSHNKVIEFDVFNQSLELKLVLVYFKSDSSSSKYKF